MTFLLVAPLRRSLKDKRKDCIPLHESASKTSKFENELRQTSFLHAKGNCCVPPSHAKQKETVRSAALKDGLSRAVHSSSSNNLHPPHSPLALPPIGRALHPGGDALVHMKTSHLPVKACSETS